MNDHAPKMRKRRFLRFRLRSLFLLMLVVGVVLGWKVSQARKQQRAVAWVQSLGGTVRYSYELADGGVLFDPQPPGPNWLRNQVGIDFLDKVVQVSLPYESNVSDVSQLACLTSLTLLDLDGTQVSDLSPLTRMTRLESLYLEVTRVKDLSPLAGLPSLKYLFLSKTPVDDLSIVSELTSLEYLHLDDTQVSDLSPLAGSSSLTWITLSNTQVTDLSPLGRLTTLTNLSLLGLPVSQVAVEELQAALPQCLINADSSRHLPNPSQLGQTSSDDTKPLWREQSGTYEELIARDNPDGLIVVFMRVFS